MVGTPTSLSELTLLDCEVVNYFGKVKGTYEASSDQAQAWPVVTYTYGLMTQEQHIYTMDGTQLNAMVNTEPNGFSYIYTFDEPFQYGTHVIEGEIYHHKAGNLPVPLGTPLWSPKLGDLKCNVSFEPVEPAAEQTP